jgi:3-deoxy-D-manno-octulosonic-acid transferase
LIISGRRVNFLSRMILFFYNLALHVVLVVGAPWWLFRMITTQKYREGLPQRLGFVPSRFRKQLAGLGSERPSSGSMPSPSARCWLSAVWSIPSSRTAEYFVAISTTTRTGQALARERFGAEPRLLLSARPALGRSRLLKCFATAPLVLAETEFWPNLLNGCYRRKIPVAVVNARISDRSWPRYRGCARCGVRFLSRSAAFLHKAGPMLTGSMLSAAVRKPSPSPAISNSMCAPPNKPRPLVC